MDVGLDPELTKWSVRSGPAIVLTGKGYKERHWLVVPSINHFGYLLIHTTTAYSSSCQCLLALSLEPRINTEGAVPPFGFVVRPGTAPTPGGPLLPLCSTKKDTE